MIYVAGDKEDKVVISKVRRVARFDDGGLLIVGETKDKRKISIELAPTASDALEMSIERLKRPGIKLAGTIVRRARDLLKNLFIRKGIEFEENTKVLGLHVDIFRKRASLFSPPEAYVFIPDIVREEIIMQYDLAFNDDSKNEKKIVCIIVAAAATESAIRKARKRVQVYDVHDEKKGDGYDSAILEVILESAFQIRFQRVS